MKETTKPRVLLYDTEITPRLAWVYDYYDTNIIKVERETYIMCFSYKWYGESKVKTVSQTDFKNYKKNPYDDYEVTKKLWELLNEADIVIAHNANKFDNRVANERFIRHHLGPVSPYFTVDTLRLAKRYFRFGSNSLDNLSKKLLGEQKSQEKHGALWYDCVNGDMKAWDKMIKYCKQDVILLDKLYTELRPWDKSHPNIANISGKVEGCPKCGSYHSQYRGFTYTSVGTYRRLQCQDCKGWYRERLAEKVTKPDYVSC